MKQKSQVKIAMLKMIEKGMAERGWNQAALSDISDVSAPTISRLLKSDYKQIGLENIFSILNALDLIETGIQKPKSPPGWTFDEKARSEYNFLTKVVSEANEEAKAGYSADTLCRNIIKDMEKQLIKIEDDLKKTNLKVIIASHSHLNNPITQI